MTPTAQSRAASTDRIETHAESGRDAAPASGGHGQMVVPKTWVPGTPRGFGDSKIAGVWLEQIETALSGFRGAAEHHSSETRYGVTLEFHLNPTSGKYRGQSPMHGSDLDNLVKQTIDGLATTRGGALPSGLRVMTGDNAVYKLTATKIHVTKDEDTGVFVTVEIL